MRYWINKLPSAEMIAMADGCLYKLNEVGFDFDEIYINRLSPLCSRGWRKHLRNTTRLRCVFGNLIVSVYDTTIGGTLDHMLSQDANDYFVVEAGCWFSFSSGPAGAVFMNLSTGLHDPSEMVRANTLEAIVEVEKKI